MSQNKLTSVSYFLKRLRDSGYYAHMLYKNYSKTDVRAWTIVIDPKCSSVLCTCFMGDPTFDSDAAYFELTDGGQYLPKVLRINTHSFEILVEHLVKYGINNKAPDYIRKTKLQKKPKVS